MGSWKFKIITPIILITLIIAGKLILWDYPVSSGKRVGNLVKISKKGKVIPTWEGTIDEGSGDKLTSYFSVRDDGLGEELFNYEGKQVIIYYEQYFVGWPWETDYNVVSWKPKDGDERTMGETGSPAMNLLSKTLFCSLLGSLIMNQDLYEQVKNHVKDNNYYLFKQFEKCND